MGARRDKEDGGERLVADQVELCRRNAELPWRVSPKLERKLTEATESTKMITNVTKPSITIRRPSRASDTGTAMLIFPGGGYWNLDWEVEGAEVADWLNSRGMTHQLPSNEFRRDAEIEQFVLENQIEKFKGSVWVIEELARNNFP